MNSRVSSWLKTPLPSTLLSPHYWATVDKGTPSRTTNQAILIVARDENGTPCPIPVDSPKVYTNVSSGSYSSLAEMVINSITNNFGASVLSELVGVSADGPYQTATFRSTLLEQLNLDDNGFDNQLVLPVTWDGAHNVNLGVTDIKNSMLPSGIHLSRDVKFSIIFCPVEKVLLFSNLPMSQPYDPFHMPRKGSHHHSTISGLQLRNLMLPIGTPLNCYTRISSKKRNTST